MTIYDVLVTFLYVVVVITAAFVFKSFHSDNIFYKKFFIKGLLVKLLGGIGFTLVYTYFYSYGGDTMAYYHDANLISRYFFTDPLEALSLIINPEQLNAAETKGVVGQLKFSILSSEFAVVRVATILNILGLNSYFSATVLFASLSYVGIWHFYLVFAKRYPHIYKQLAVAVLFIPSVFFWGSGIMKDSIVIGFLGLLVYSIDKFLEGGFKRILWGALTAYCGIVIFSIKAYVIMALTPALVIWVVMNYKDRIKNNLLRTMIVPVLLILSIVGVVVSLELLGRYKSRYSVDRFLSSAQSVQSWHYIEGSNTSDDHGRGSSYTLGEYDPTLMGAVSMFPEAVNVTLFRPYFWEVKNVAMLASATESFVIMIFTIFIFIGLGFFRVIRLLFKDPFLLMSLAFAIFFAFAVGFTSYNFGALARYKIPCIPFYIASLLILNYKVKVLKESKKMRFKAKYQSQPEEVVTAPGRFA